MCTACTLGLRFAQCMRSCEMCIRTWIKRADAHWMSSSTCMCWYLLGYGGQRGEFKQLSITLLHSMAFSVVASLVCGLSCYKITTHNSKHAQAKQAKKQQATKKIKKQAWQMKNIRQWRTWQPKLKNVIEKKENTWTKHFYKAPFLQTQLRSRRVRGWGTSHHWCIRLGTANKMCHLCWRTFLNIMYACKPCACMHEHWCSYAHRFSSHSHERQINDW